MLNKGIRTDMAADTPVYIFKDEVTKRKIKRHLQDINDIITDKDIKDAKVPGTEDAKTPVKTRRKTSEAKKDDQTTTPGTEKKVVDDTPGNPATPWDILDK